MLLLCVPGEVGWFIAKFDSKIPYTYGIYTTMSVVIGAFIGSVAFPLIMVLVDKRRDKGRVRTRGSRSVSVNSVSDLEKLRSVLQDPPLLEILKGYCMRAWCIENLLFFEAGTEYLVTHKSQSPEENKTKAWRIYDMFVKVSSMLEVNLDMPTREAILEQLEADKYPADLFEEALKTVFIMLRFGVYREFSKTPQFLLKYPEGPNHRNSKIEQLEVSSVGESLEV